MKQSYGKIYWLLIAIAFLLYGNTIKNDYALDDEFVVGDLSPAKKGIKGIPKILTSYHAKDESGNEYEYRPMVKISYALEVEFFGNKVHIHHFFNIVYYALCLMLLFRMLLLLFENYSLQTILWVVILFAFIPLHSEVVASLKNRDVLLSFIFSMLVLIYFLKWQKDKKTIYLILVPIFFFFALASKLDALPLMAILPLVYIQKNKTNFNQQQWIKILGTIVLVVVLLFLMYVALKKGQKLVLDPKLKQRVFNYFENPLYFHNELKYRIITLFTSLGFYIWMLIFPIKMSCYYGYNVIPFNSIFNFYGIIGIMSFMLLAYLFFKRFKQGDILWYGVMFFSVCISMFLNFVKPAPGIVADRFVFMASVGWAMILAYCIEWVYQKFIAEKKQIEIKELNWWNVPKLKVFLMVYFIVLSIWIWKRNYEWRYKLYLYEADVKKYPESVKLHILYGSQIIIEYLQNTGRLSSGDMHRYLGIAYEEFQRGLQLDSSCGSCYNNVAYLLMNWKKNYEASIPYLLKSYQIDSTRKEVLTNIAISYFKTNRNNDTVEIFIRKAIRRDKDKSYEIPFDVMKEYCKREKLYAKGIAFFKEQLQERPRSEYLHFALAELQMLNGDTTAAIHSYEKLLEINPNYPKVAEFLSELKEKHFKQKKKEK